MKKLIITLLFLLLSYSVSLAANQQLAWMGPVVAGSVVATSCTTSNDSKLWNPTTQPGTSQSNLDMIAVKITVASPKTITAYKVRENDGSGSDTGNGIIRIINHDSDNNWPSLTGATPNAYAGSTSETINASSMSDSPSSNVDEYVISTPITLTAGTYWIMRETQNGGTINGYYTGSVGDRVCYKTVSQTSWTCTDDYMYDMELWGCN